MPSITRCQLSRALISLNPFEDLFLAEIKMTFIRVSPLYSVYIKILAIIPRAHTHTSKSITCFFSNSNDCQSLCFHRGCHRYHSNIALYCFQSHIFAYSQSLIPPSILFKCRQEDQKPHQKKSMNPNSLQAQ